MTDFISAAVELGTSAAEEPAAPPLPQPHAAGVLWTDDHSDALKEYVGEGFSYSQSADKINEKFGTHYSRNAAIGRANRIGLACPIKPGGHAMGEKRRRRDKFVKAKPRMAPTRINKIYGLTVRAIEIIPRHLSVLELETNDCRFPYGGDGVSITFCGCRKLEGSSYCPGHYRLTRSHFVALSDAEKQRRRQTFADNQKASWRAA